MTLKAAQGHMNCLCSIGHVSLAIGGRSLGRRCHDWRSVTSQHVDHVTRTCRAEWSVVSGQWWTVQFVSMIVVWSCSAQSLSLIHWRESAMLICITLLLLLLLLLRCVRLQISSVCLSKYWRRRGRTSTCQQGRRWLLTVDTHIVTTGSCCALTSSCCCRRGWGDELSSVHSTKQQTYHGLQT